MFSPRITISDVYAVAKALWNKELSGRSPIVHEFEKQFAEYNKVKYASAANSGSTALFLALKALKLPRGSEVICPAWGYVAIPNAIIQADLKPKFVDVELDTGNINPKLIKKGKAKAIVAIDTYGHPCDYDALRKFGLPIIQDAAEALGAEYKGKKISGDIATFSFFANKTITTGEGGMVVSDSKELINEVNALKDQYGSDKRYFHTDYGYSLCMSALQASLGISQLKRIDKVLNEKRKKVEILNKEIGNWFTEKDYAKHGCWAYGYFGKPDKNSRPFFYPYNHLPMYKNNKVYPVAEYLSENGNYYLT